MVRICDRFSQVNDPFVLQDFFGLEMIKCRIDLFDEGLFFKFTLFPLEGVKYRVEHPEYLHMLGILE